METDLEQEILKAHNLDPKRYHINDNFEVEEKAPPPKSEMGGSFARSVRDSLGGVAGGLAAPLAASYLVPGLGEVTLPATVVAGLLGLGGSMAGRKGQELLAGKESGKPFEGNALMSSDVQRAEDYKEHPYAQTLGGLTAMAAGARPSLDTFKNLSTAVPRLMRGGAGMEGLEAAEKAAVYNTAVNTGIQGGSTAYHALKGEDINPGAEALGLVGGLGFGKPRFTAAGPEGVTERPRMGGDIKGMLEKPIDELQVELKQGGKKSLDAVDNTPERPESIDIQSQLTRNLEVPTKKALLIPKGSKDLTPEQAFGLVPVETIQGKLWVNPNKLSGPEELTRISGEKSVNGQDLGYYSSSKPSIREAAEKGLVSVTAKINGVPDVLTEVVTPDKVGEVQAYYAKNYPGAEVSVVKPEDILIGRTQDRRLEDINAKRDLAARAELAKPSTEELVKDKLKGVIKQGQDEFNSQEQGITKGQEEYNQLRQRDPSVPFEPTVKAPEVARAGQAQDELDSSVLAQRHNIEQASEPVIFKAERQGELKDRAAQQQEMAEEHARQMAEGQAEQDQKDVHAAGEVFKQQREWLKEQNRLADEQRELERVQHEQALAHTREQADQVKAQRESLERQNKESEKLMVERRAEEAGREFKRKKFQMEGVVENEPTGAISKVGEGSELGMAPEPVETGKQWFKGKKEYPVDYQTRQQADPNYQAPTEEDTGPIVGKPFVAKNLNRWMAEAGHDVRETNSPEPFTTKEDPTVRYGRQSAGEDGRSTLEVSDRAETSAHEGLHAALNSNPKFREQLLKSSGLTEEELVTRSAKSLMGRIEKNDFGFWNDFKNAVKYYTGSKDPATLERVLQNELVYYAKREGGSVGPIEGRTTPEGSSTPNYQPAVGSAINQIKDEKAKAAIESAHDARTQLRGQVGYDIVRKLQAFPRDLVNKVAEKHLDYYNSGKPVSFKGDEVKVSRLLQDHMDMVGDLQHKLGYERDIQASPFYFPEMLGPDVREAVKDGSDSPKFKEVSKAIGDFWEGKGMPDAHTEAEKYLLRVSGAKGGVFGAEDISGFGALHKAAGYGLPLESESGIKIREPDALRSLIRYGENAATDMAWQREVKGKLTPEEISRAESTKPWQTVRELYFNPEQGKSPVLKSLSKAASTMAIGPVSKLFEIGDNLHNASLFGAKGSDIIKGVNEVVTNWKEIQDRATKGGMLRPGGVMDENYGSNESPGPAGVISRASDKMAHVTGTDFLERTSRTLSYALSEQTARSRKLAGDEKWFKERNTDINDPQAVEKAATQMSEMIQGRRDSRELGEFWLKGIAADVAPIHRWAIGHSGNVLREIKNGNYAPLIQYMLAGLGMGMLRKESSKFITGKRGAQPELGELKAAGKGLTDPEGLAMVTDLLRNAGIGGALTSVADYGMNKYLGKSPQIIFNPLASTVKTGLLDFYPQWKEAVDNGVGGVEAAKLLGENILGNMFQVWRVGANLMKSGEDRSRESDRRDLREYRQLTSGVKPFTGDYNPALADQSRKFQEAETPEDALEAGKTFKPKRTPRDYVMPAEMADDQRYVRYLNDAGRGEEDISGKLVRSARLKAIQPMKRMIVEQGKGR